MRALTEADLRPAFVNASLKERKTMSLPHLDALEWDRLDYLGWRDAKIPSLGYVIAILDDDPVGIVLRQSEGTVRSRPQCSWCEDVTLPNDVVMFGARRTGSAGRNGNSVGTLLCAHFECSRNVRKLPPVAYLGFDVEMARLRRIDTLHERVGSFVRDIRGEG